MAAYKVNDRVIFSREDGVERLCTILNIFDGRSAYIRADTNLPGCVQSFYVTLRKLKPAATMRVEGNTLILEDA